MIRRHSTHGKLQLFWLCYVQVRLMVATPAPHSGLLPKPGVLWGTAGAGLSHEWSGVLHGPPGWPLMGAVPWVPRALDTSGNQWTQEKSSSWCWAQPWPETMQRCGWDGAWLSQKTILCPGWRWCAWRSLGRLLRRVGLEGALRDLTQSSVSQVKPEALVCSGIWSTLVKTLFGAVTWAEMCRAVIFSAQAFASTAQKIISHYLLFPMIRKTGPLT